MKEPELRRRATCGLCQKKIGACHLPIFLTMTIERYRIDAAALQRQTGLEMMLGGCAALAMHMGPDEDLAPMIEAKTFTVCGACAVKEWCPAQILQDAKESEL